VDLVVGTFTPSVLLGVAARTGRLEATGVAVREEPVTSSPGQFRSLLSGDLDIALTSPDNVLAYRFNPSNPLGRLADVRIVSTLDRGMGLALYARPGLSPELTSSTWTFGVDVPSSGFALALFALAERLGVARDSVRVSALGSTPNRLRALLAGECDATMLNAGNELVAESAGCPRLGDVTQVAAPYVGTVVCVAGDRRLDAGRRLAGALHLAAQDVLAGRVDDLAAALARELLGLDEPLSRRYVERLKDPAQGLVATPGADLEGLASVVRLRQRYLAAQVDGRDVLEGALEEASGLVVGQTAGP
jgi:ABC-type nitrate/sulfonate/bicarbonate transport system substrate-binding protein